MVVYFYVGYVVEVVCWFGIFEVWIWVVMCVESGGNVCVVLCVGVMGLM